MDDHLCTTQTEELRPGGHLATAAEIVTTPRTTCVPATVWIAANTHLIYTHTLDYQAHIGGLLIQPLTNSLSSASLI